MEYTGKKEIKSQTGSPQMKDENSKSSPKQMIIDKSVYLSAEKDYSSGASVI